MPPRPPDPKVAAFRGPPGSCDSQGGITIGPERGELGAENVSAWQQGPSISLLALLLSICNPWGDQSMMGY